ncbi:MAG: extracellular solute-binding protein [Clostridia bacterium]|nr:extracellular solute-binding protein [Clostridia bacterium]
MNKRALTLLLIAALAATASCGGAAAGSDTTAASADTTTAAPAETIVNLDNSDLLRKDFGGREFLIFARKPTNFTDAWHLLDVESITGETLNDAIFNRNKKVEDVYNVDIAMEYVTDGDFKSTAMSHINAGDSEYAAIFGRLDHLYPMAQEGYFMNWHTLPYTDTSAEWWDQAAVRDLTYKNRLYALTGDISTSANSRVYSLVFNKDLCRDLNLDLPYQTVLDGKWTVDVFNKYITNVNQDVNGDAQMDYEDRWGYFSQNGNSYMMYFAGGGRVVQTNAKGELELVFNDARNVELATKALEISIDESKTLMANQLVSENGGSWAAASAWFAGGNALMRSSVFEPVPRDYRSMDTDFGVLPYPKLDENQDKYYTMAEELSIMLTVPVTADAEFSSLILEAMAIESVNTVSPAFYDVCLNGKIVRDEESKEMLDILFENKVFDIGLVTGIGSFKSTMTSMEAADDTGVASKYASLLSSAEEQLKNITEKFEALDE